jgi:hypothetical protein
MPDVRELLHQAAAPPTRPLDVAALHRAARRRRSRLVAWLASLGALAAVGTPLGLQWAGSGSHDTVRTLPAPASTTTTTTTTTTTIVGLTSNQGVVPAGAADLSSVAGTGLDTQPSDQTEGQSSGDASYPPASGCSVDNSGAAPDELRTCRFTATTVGGWAASYGPSVPAPSGPPVGGFALGNPSSSVLVTHGGVRTEYDANPKNGVACTNGIIQPGDLVEVRMRASSSTGPNTPYYVSAGDSYGCAHS